VVTDREGKVYERYEYTPYGEVWIEWENRGVTRNGTLPYRFTGKELDEETGLYYYGARYLDPRASRWLSADPAVGEYLPEAPTTEEARKRNGNLPGTGGIYNYVNLHVYHYAGNNPVKYVDPDGRQSLPYFTSQGYFGYLLKHNPVMSLLNIINSALSGDKSAQTQAGNIAAGTVNQIANDALNATKTAVETTLEATADTAGFVSSATGSISVGTALVGIEGVSAGAAVTSDIAGLVEVGSRTAKGVISGDTGDQKEAKNVLRRYAIGMAIGAIIGGFKGNNPLHNKPIADKIVDFSTKIVPQIYSEIDKQISQ
jgi:RHS repeat-associated protein